MRVQQWSRIVDPQEQQQAPGPGSSTLNDSSGSVSIQTGSTPEMAATLPPPAATSGAAATAPMPAPAPATAEAGAEAGAADRPAPHLVFCDATSMVAAKALYIVEVTRARASFAEQQHLLNQVSNASLKSDLATCVVVRVHEAKSLYIIDACNALVFMPTCR